MTSRGSRRKLALVDESQESRKLTISLKRGAMPISGTLVTVDGETSFTGWIELAGLIEAVHARSSAATSPDGDRSSSRHGDT